MSKVHSELTNFWCVEVIGKDENHFAITSAEQNQAAY